jgi:hypothetical protein
MGKLLEPMTDFKLTGNPKFPMDMGRLRNSQLALLADGEAFRAAVLLWGAAWESDPVGSLPDNDAALCAAAGLGRDRETWKRIKDEAMRGFKLCSDGRRYHEVVCQLAREIRGRSYRASSHGKRAAQARWGKNNGDNFAENAKTEQHAQGDARAYARAMPVHKTIVKSKVDGKTIVGEVLPPDPEKPRPVTKRHGVDSQSRRAPVSSCAVPAIPPGQASPTSLTVKQQPSTPDDRGVRGVNLPAEVPKAKSKKGNQLPDDWTPPPEAWAYGRERLGLSDQQIESYAEDMRRWAIANGHREVGRKQGEKGWRLTFEGWMKREEQRKAEGRARSSKPGRTDMLKRVMAEVAQAEKVGR